MSKISWKTIGLATAVAVGTQLAVTGAATAFVMPVPAQTAVIDIAQADRQVSQADYRTDYYMRQSRRQHYDRRRHGARYSHRRNGYRYQHCGYWYASAWWLVPAVAIATPTQGRRGNGHVNRCLSRYNSYNPRTDMFLGYDGRHHRCRDTSY